MTISEF